MIKAFFYGVLFLAVNILAAILIYRLRCEHFGWSVVVLIAAIKFDLYCYYRWCEWLNRDFDDFESSIYD